PDHCARTVPDNRSDSAPFHCPKSEPHLSFPFLFTDQTFNLEPAFLPSASWSLAQQRRRVLPRVYLTVGNRSGLTGYRSNRSGPVPVWSGTKPAQIQNLNLNSKNEKFLKILQGATNLMVSNFLKNRSFSIVCGDLKLNKKKRAYKSIQIQCKSSIKESWRVHLDLNMLYKYLFSILCGHLNLNQKKLNLTGYQSDRPVTSQTGRYTGTNQLNGEV